MNNILKKLIAISLLMTLSFTSVDAVALAADTGEDWQGIQDEGSLYEEAENFADSADDSIAQDTPADVDCGEQLTWSIDEDGLLTIAGTGDMKEWTEDDPAPWHELADSVKEILIEDEVTTIGSYAFADLTNVEKVTIGSGVNYIGTHAFDLCGDENTVYVYNGTEADWSSVNVEEDNEALHSPVFADGESEENPEDTAETAESPVEDAEDALEGSEENIEDSYEIATLADSALATPALGTATASSGKITITWSAVSGASGYRVYRKTSGGSWAAIGNTEDGTSYTDSSKLDIGTTYYYTVRAYKGDYSAALANTYDSAYWSDFVSAGVSAKAVGALSTPSLKSASSSGGRITVTWNSVSGASGYRVYRKTSGGSWAAIGNTTGATSYVDGKVDPGTTYYYTIRAYKGDYSTALANAHYAEYWSDFVSSGVSTKAEGVLSTPSLKSATASAGQITVTWNSVSGASGYRVYRKTSSSSWAAIGYTTGSTSYTDGKAEVGTTYYYTVRAYKGDYSTALANAHYAQYWSDFVSAGVSAKAAGALSTPSLKNATASAGQITVTWNSVSGASGYRVYRKASGGSWAAIGNTTGTSYTDSNKLDVGTTYYYTVRAYKGDYSTAVANAHYAQYWSDFVSAGVSAKAVSSIATPSLKNASCTGGKITVTWNSVSGVNGYRVYRKTSGGSWAAIGTSTVTNYTDEKVEPDTTYYYTVRAYKGDKDTALANAHYAEYWSDFNSSGVSAKASSVLSTPTLKSAKTSSGNIVITWSDVSNASGYRIYRKTSSGSWSAIDTTTATSYTDSNVSSGTTYFYTVRAYQGDVSTALANAHYASYWSGFDSTGVTPGPGIVKNGSSYYYVGDDGIKVTTTAIQQAVDFVVAHTTDSWSNSKKLETCFNYMHDHYSYTRDYATPKASDLLDYASYYFTNKTGNCYKYAASSACIIKVLGYDSRVAVGQIASSSSGGGMTAHGWAEFYDSGTWYMFDVNMNVYRKTQSQTSRARTVDARYTLTASNGKASFN